MSPEIHPGGAAWLVLEEKEWGMNLLDPSDQAARVVCGSFDHYPDRPGGYAGVLVRTSPLFWRWMRWYLQDFCRQLGPGAVLFLEVNCLPSGRGGAGGVKQWLRQQGWVWSGVLGCERLGCLMLPAGLLEIACRCGLERALSLKASRPSYSSNRGIAFRQRARFAESEFLVDEHCRDTLFQQHFGDWGNPVLPREGEEATGVGALLSNPLKSRVVVLSPHPDDELIGCGGTIFGLAQAGAEIHVIQMTEGMTCLALRGEAESVRRQIRWQEAAAVAERLGFTGHYWETGSSGGLEDSEETVARLTEVLAGLKPDLVFVPSGTDRHPEHRLANLIFERARGVIPGSCRVLEYPVWGFLAEADVAVEVTAFHRSVLDALYLYKTAMKAEDYVTRCRLLAGTYGERLLGSFNRPVEVFRSSTCLNRGDSQ